MDIDNIYLKKKALTWLWFQFAQMKAKMQLQQQFKQLTFLLSDESLQLLPEYQQRVQVSNVTLPYFNRWKIVTLQVKLGQLQFRM